MPNNPDVITMPYAFAQSVHNSLDDAIQAIPAGKSNALVIDGTVNQTSGPAFQAMWVHKSPNGWGISLQGAYDGPHGVQGKVQGIYAW